MATADATITLAALAPGVSLSLSDASDDRVGCVLYNEGGEDVYVALADTASAAAYTFKLLPGQTAEVGSDWTGGVSGFTPDDAAAVLVTELGIAA